MQTEQRIKILVVDDVPEKLMAIRAILEELSEEIVTVDSGREALRRLLTEDFAVILLDVDMPGLNGFETAKLIRQRRRSEHTPIIFITGYNDETLISEGYSLGAVDYILAPVNANILRAKIAVFVELFKKTEQIKEQAKKELALTQMQAARDAAETANRAKSEFLANISHELRTPMNSIMGMTELAMQERQSDLARDYLETVLGSAKALLGLLNEILDFSRLEAGKFVLEAMPFDLRGTIEATMKSLDVRAFEKDLEMTWSLGAQVPNELIGDPVRLNQILFNLVGNAIKFTTVGQIDVRIEVESQTGEEVTLKFSIADTGIGISPADQKLIFSPFTQVDSSMTRRFGGTGLGLAIATDLISQMRGKIWVESEPGVGSTFSFTARFPLQVKEGVISEEWPSNPMQGKHALVVDDNASNRTLVQEALSEWGVSVTLAEDGHQALKRLTDAVESGQHYDFLLVDGIMPEIDGFAVIRAIQADSVTQGATVLMLSAGHRRQYAEECVRLNVNAVLQKPITRGELRKVVSRVLAESLMTVEPPVDDAKSPAEDFRNSLRILIAEDMRINQKMIATILGNRGHQVEIANDGREALERVEVEDFDMVLMDVQMPVMDGFQATAAIRQLAVPKKAGIPIIALTAHAMPGDKDRCLESGMNGYLTKPLDSKTLIEVVERAGGELRGIAAS